jgi:pyruvate dehydrogenase E1 component alpha subunit
MTEEDFASIDREAVAEVDASVRFAEAGTWEPADELARDVCTPAAQRTASG